MFLYSRHDPALDSSYLRLGRVLSELLPETSNPIYINNRPIQAAIKLTLEAAKYFLNSSDLLFFLSSLENSFPLSPNMSLSMKVNKAVMIHINPKLPEI